MSTPEVTRSREVWEEHVRRGPEGQGRDAGVLLEEEVRSRVHKAPIRHQIQGEKLKILPDLGKKEA